MIPFYLTSIAVLRSRISLHVYVRMWPLEKTKDKMKRKGQTKACIEHIHSPTQSCLVHSHLLGI